MSLQSHGSPSIDIMMPFYGKPELFRVAVKSVLSQTDADWRLTIVDDAYPDDSVARWAEELDDPRIVVLRNPANLGVSGSFRRCVELAEADYAVIMGCDDVMAPEYVARMRALLLAHDAIDYVQPGVQVIDHAGAASNPLVDRVKLHYKPRIDAPRTLGGEELARSLLRGNWTYFPSILWRTPTLKKHGFSERLDVVLDLALQLDIIGDGGSMLLDTERTFFYRRHGDSVSSWTAADGTRFREEKELFREAEMAMRRRGWTRAAAAAHHHFSSRLNAITRIPSAIASRDGAGTRSLLAHSFGVHRASAAARVKLSNDD